MSPRPEACGACGGEVLWARLAGKAELVAVDAEPAPNGDLVLSILDGRLVIGKFLPELHAADRRRFRYHRAACELVTSAQRARLGTCPCGKVRTECSGCHAPVCRAEGHAPHSCLSQPDVAVQQEEASDGLVR